MQFGTVTGRILATIADRVTDPDVNPDVVPVGGKVVFTPSVSAAISSSEGAIVLPTPIEAVLDSEGYLSLNGERGVSLVATDSPDLNPTGFTYTVTFADLQFDKFKLSYKPFSIAVPAGQTVDLSTLTPVGSSNGAIIIRGAQGERGPQGDPGPAVSKVSLGLDQVDNTPDLSKPVSTAQAATLAPIVGARPGNRVVFLGDSITQGSDQASTNFRGTAWPLVASLRSAGRIVHVKNAGVSGNTTQNMLDRFDTDVTPLAPAVVSILAGTNDSAPATFAAWTAQITALVAKVRSIGAVPILATVPPTALAVWRQQTVQRQNMFLRNFANRNGTTLVDFFALLADPITGGYKSAYYNDGIHPNAAGYAAMGALYNDVVTPTLPAYAPAIAYDDADPFNLVHGGCFTAASGTALPAGWIDNAGTPAGSTISYTSDATVPGQMLQVTQAGTTGVRQINRMLYMGATTLSSAVAAGATSLTLPARADYRGVLWIGSGATAEVVRILSSSGGGPQTETLVSPLQFAHAAGEAVVANALPGDVLSFGGRVSSDGGVPVVASVQALGSGSTTFTSIGALVSSITRGVWVERLTVPTGSTLLGVNLQANNGSGTVSWGQVSLYNLTRMGLV